MKKLCVICCILGLLTLAGCATSNNNTNKSGAYAGVSGGVIGS